MQDVGTRLRRNPARWPRGVSVADLLRDEGALPGDGAGLNMAGLASCLARSTLRATDEAWETHLARAAVLIAAVGAVLSILTIIGGLVDYA